MKTNTYAGRTVEMTDDGFLTNPADWTEAMAPELARHVGIDPLTERHLTVIRYMRKEFLENGQIPTIRRLGKSGVMGTKELYELFPGGPAKKAALIAGLGKPQGCV